MKRIIVTFLLSATLVFLSQHADAQVKLKIGYIDSNELLIAMPERDSAKVNIENYAKSLEKQLGAMSSEFEKKYKEYTDNQITYSELIRSTKQLELQEMKNRIENFQQQAQQDLENKESELLNPIVQKAKKAIEDVAKENGFTYILDVASGSLLFYEGGENILPMVKKKLGL